jgi:hypothetical protein
MKKVKIHELWEIRSEEVRRWREGGRDGQRLGEEGNWLRV